MQSHATLRLFKVVGDMDAAAMRLRRPEFEELANSAQDVALDMDGVTFIDSSGVGAIVFLYKRLLETHHKLTLQNLSGQPLQLLTFLRLDSLLAR